MPLKIQHCQVGILKSFLQSKKMLSYFFLYVYIIIGIFFSGESNVYTIGFIGEHKVVSTKLPAIGPGRTAQISSGNTTTRLLGKYTQTV